MNSKNIEYYQLRIDSLDEYGDEYAVMYVNDYHNLDAAMYNFANEVHANLRETKTYGNGEIAAYGILIQVSHITEVVDVKTNETVKQEVLKIYAECKIYNV